MGAHGADQRLLAIAARSGGAGVALLSRSAEPWPYAHDPKSASYLSFAAAKRAFADGSDTPRAFLERCIEQIERREPQIKAFVRLDFEGARQQADASTTRWQRGQPLSAVDGLPVGIKGIVSISPAGLPRSNSALFRENVADDRCRTRRCAASWGALVLGKTTTTELTMALPAPTLNPWSLEHTPGGSSSGSAAAVAARMLPLATGSQVRGSVLRPASICGIIGMKPTFGALNRYGGIDPSPSLNHLGFLGGTLTDVWEAAHHIGNTAGGDPGYPALLGARELLPPRRPKRLVRQYTSGWPKTDEASQQAFAALPAFARG